MHRPCLERSCRAVAAPGEARCTYHRLAHERQRRAMRDPHELRFYGSADWQRLRAEVLADAAYMCEAQTLSDGAFCNEPANTAGHIVPWRQRPDLGLERDNVRAECRRHQRLA